MSDGILSEITKGLKLAIFRRGATGELCLVGKAPEWLSILWPQVTEAGAGLTSGTSPFLENFLIDAASCWDGKDTENRVNSGPWVELDSSGQDHHLQATALVVNGMDVLLVEEIGSDYRDRRSILQKAHEKALAFEGLQRAEQALAEQKRLLEQRVEERTAELSQANAALQEEVIVRCRFADRLQSVHEIDRAILSAKSPETIAEAALRGLHHLLPCEHASVIQLDADSGQARLLGSMDKGKFSFHVPWKIAEERLQEIDVLNSGKPHRIERAQNLFGLDSEIWPLIIDLPLIAEETLVGVLNLASHSQSALSLEHEEIAEEIATQLAVAMQQARLLSLLSTGRERLRVLSRQLVEVQETERRFIARELHDEVGQELTGIKLTLAHPGHAESGLPKSKVEEAIALVDQLMDRVRQLSLDLRPQVLDDLGLLPAMNWLCLRYFKQTGVKVHLKCGFEPRRFPTQIETAAFRIVQEALTNIARHAGVRDATVRLWLAGVYLGLQIEDQGTGFDAEHALAGSASSGVTGMRERAQLLGGHFTLETKPGRGTRLTVELPLAAEFTPPAKEIGEGP